MKSKISYFDHALVPLLFLLALGIHSPEVCGFSFSFIKNGSDNLQNADFVTHSSGYNGQLGSGASIAITVGIDPTSVNASTMVTSVQNVIRTWNSLVPTTNNLTFGTNNNVPTSSFDFESVLLHEMGHALGLSHPNLGVISAPVSGVGGISGADTDFTQSSKGTNRVYDFDAGTDGIIGSADDIRGDDVNLHWFNKNQNDPFNTTLGVVDSTTYSRNTTDLPVGDNFVANPGRDVATTFGFSADTTEAVMQQGTLNGEAQRTLGADDVAGIKYAFSGIDELAGTTDDYSFLLVYNDGATTTADIVIDFDNARTGFAVTSLQALSIGGTTDHLVITNSDIFFNESNTWFFNTISNDTSIPEPSSYVLAFLCGVGIFYASRQRKRTII